MCSFKRWTCAIGAGLSMLGAAQAQSTVLITFDAGDPIGGLPVGAVLGSQYQAWGVSFQANAFAGNGGPTGAWATNTDMTIVAAGSTAAGAVGTPALVSGNLLRSFDNYLNENGDASFSALFSSPISSFSADFAGVRTPESAQLFVYGGDTLLGVVAAPPGSAGQVRLSFSSATPITRVAITPGDFDDWVGIDNIAFTTVVPEPASAGMLATGAALLLFMRQRARKRAGTEPKQSTSRR